MSLQQWCRDTAPPCPIAAGGESGATVVARDSVPPASSQLGRHGPRRDANTARCFFLLLLSLEESNQRTCEILTHDALSTPRPESFGGVKERQSHRVLHIHRNLAPSSASTHRTPPKISRGAGSFFLGRHGPYRDANRVECLSTGLFLLLLSLEESNQRTLRNRNARFNRRRACRRFRCVRSARRRESACTLHRNLTPSIEASLRTQPPIPRGAGSFFLGRHGPCRDANRVQCLSTGLFLLLLSLEESNQRTLRNRNARFNRHPACRRFRCVRSG
jgi:hypothetical protein